MCTRGSEEQRGCFRHAAYYFPQAAWAAPIEVRRNDGAAGPPLVVRRGANVTLQVIDYCLRTALPYGLCVELLGVVSRAAAEPAGCVPGADGFAVCGSPAAAPVGGGATGAAVESVLLRRGEGGEGAAGGTVPLQRGGREAGGSYLWRRAAVQPSPCDHYFRMLRNGVPYFAPSFERVDGADVWELMRGGLEVVGHVCGARDARLTRGPLVWPQSADWTLDTLLSASVCDIWVVPADAPAVTPWCPREVRQCARSSPRLLCQAPVRSPPA